MSNENKSNSVRQIVVVTGGSRGLGRSTVLSLAKRGIDAIFTYNPNRGEAEKVTALVASMERKAIALQLDTGMFAPSMCSRKTCGRHWRG
jgi:NAD(P)-dependent dehydrogenase (short-subunit alcohol dehydrogenase family)